jgi:type VI protein secretion system component Hcp
MHESYNGVPADTLVTLSNASVVGFDTQRSPTATTATQETVTFAYQKLTHSSCGT